MFNQQVSQTFSDHPHDNQGYSQMNLHQGIIVQPLQSFQQFDFSQVPQQQYQDAMKNLPYGGKYPINRLSTQITRVSPSTQFQRGVNMQPVRFYVTHQYPMQNIQPGNRDHG